MAFWIFPIMSGLAHGATISQTDYSTLTENTVTNPSQTITGISDNFTDFTFKVASGNYATPRLNIEQLDGSCGYNYPPEFNYEVWESDYFAMSEGDITVTAEDFTTVPVFRADACYNFGLSQVSRRIYGTDENLFPGGQATAGELEDLYFILNDTGGPSINAEFTRPTNTENLDDFPTWNFSATLLPEYELETGDWYKMVVEYGNEGTEWTDTFYTKGGEDYVIAFGKSEELAPGGYIADLTVYDKNNEVVAEDTIGFVIDASLTFYHPINGSIIRDFPTWNFWFSAEEYTFGGTDKYTVEVNYTDGVSNWTDTHTTFGGLDVSLGIGKTRILSNGNYSAYAVLKDADDYTIKTTATLNFTIQNDVESPVLTDPNDPDSIFYVDCSAYDEMTLFEGFLPGVACYMQKSIMSIAHFLFAPHDISLDSIRNAVDAIQTDFPFSVFFGISETILEASENYEEVDDMGKVTVWETEFDFFPKEGLKDLVGEEIKNQIFYAIEMVAWAGTGLLIAMIVF